MRFLIVDDDETIHLFLQAMLAPYGEFVTALSGQEAVDKFAAAMQAGCPFDTVMMDILMPGMDGHEASGIMRSLENEAGITESDRFNLVMITCMVDKVHVHRAFASAGAALYIVKPLSKDDVIRQLKDHRII